ncbi:hypothetical protein N0V90_001913 [Kalmusia sp. IMI 367209]|nr:hypothetical protein N0V90_001913 [Kalmusia sp. IMI 367209]
MSLDRYAAIHTSIPEGLGDGRPTADQVLRDQDLVGNHWQGKVIFITGGTAGLGAEAARVLHKTGAKIFIAGRDVAKGEKLTKEIGAANPEFPPVEVIEMDQSTLQGVRNGTAEFLKRSGGKLNVLMPNAGIVASKELTTKEGFETLWGVNYLATFLLVKLLTPALIASTTSSFNSRLVVVSSAGHRACNVDPANYTIEGDQSKSYGQSKTATILMANEFERRYGYQGVHALSLNPGVIMDTEISRGLPGDSATRRPMFYKMFPLLAKYEKSVEQGAATQVWASVAKELEGKGGLYLDDVQVAQETPAADQKMYCLPGFASWIWDEDVARTLWEDSLQMVGFISQP